jgi:hypothetical protein
VQPSEFKQIEAVQKCSPRTARFGEGGAQAFEVGQTALVDHHAFAVNGGGRDGQREHRLDDERHLVGPVFGVAAEHAHAVAIAPGVNL